MERVCTTPTDRPAHDSDPGRRHRRCRLVPPAVTPITAGDLARGGLDHVRGRGRDRFRRAIESCLDADGSATYTSFRRTLGACLQELSAHDEDGRQKVLIPAFCSSDFPDAIEGVGLEAVRYDVDPETLSLDLTSLEGALGTEPLAVVAVNVLGYTSPMEALANRCEAADAFLVEALGYALGTVYENDRLGTFGDCAVLNFQQGKPIPVGGGMVVSQNAALNFADEGRPAVAPNAGVLSGYAALSRPRPYYCYRGLLGRLRDVGLVGRVTTHPESKTAVTYSSPYATISNFQGSVGRRIVERHDEYRAHRTRTARYYADNLSSESAVDLVRPIEGLSTHQYVRYPIRLRSETLRDEVQTALRTVGIQATTLYDWPILDADTVPGAATIQRTILTLPTHPYVDDRDRRRIVETIRTAVARHEGGS
jgi:dTDP-4-amino-4,6-dideoxygalactose transaminase